MVMSMVMMLTIVTTKPISKLSGQLPIKSNKIMSITKKKLKRQAGLHRTLITIADHATKKVTLMTFKMKTRCCGLPILTPNNSRSSNAVKALATSNHSRKTSLGVVRTSRTTLEMKTITQILDQCHHQCVGLEQSPLLASTPKTTGWTGPSSTMRCQPLAKLAWQELSLRICPEEVQLRCRTLCRL